MKKDPPATAPALPGAPGPAMKRLLSQTEIRAVHGGLGPYVPKPRPVPSPPRPPSPGSGDSPGNN